MYYMSCMLSLHFDVRVSLHFEDQCPWVYIVSTEVKENAYGIFLSEVESVVNKVSQLCEVDV